MNDIDKLMQDLTYIFGDDPTGNNYYCQTTTVKRNDMTEHDVNSINKVKTPAIYTNQYENDEAITVEALVPGFESDNIKLDITDDKLTITTIPKPQPYYGLTMHKGFNIIKSTQILQLHNIDAEKATAKLNNGILTVTIPKILPKKQQKIPIS